MIYTVTFNPAIDYVLHLTAPLAVGEINRTSDEACQFGGKGINVSGVLRELARKHRPWLYSWRNWCLAGARLAAFRPENPLHPPAGRHDPNQR